MTEANVCHWLAQERYTTVEDKSIEPATSRLRERRRKYYVIKPHTTIRLFFANMQTDLNLTNSMPASPAGKNDTSVPEWSKQQELFSEHIHKVFEYNCRRIQQKQIQSSTLYRETSNADLGLIQINVIGSTNCTGCRSKTANDVSGQQNHFRLQNAKWV